MEALQLLPSFLAAPPTRGPTIAALDAMVLDVFPPTCRDLWKCPAGQVAVDYGLQLLALLDAGAAAAARHVDVAPVLTLLQYVVKEMGTAKGHLLQLPVAWRLAAIAAAPWSADAESTPAGGVDERAASTADAMAGVAMTWLWEGAANPVDVKYVLFHVPTRGDACPTTPQAWGIALHPASHLSAGARTMEAGLGHAPPVPAAGGAPPTGWT